MIKKIEIETKALALAKAIVESVSLVKDFNAACIAAGGIDGLSLADKESFLDKIMTPFLKLKTFLKHKDPALDGFSILSLVQTLSDITNSLSQRTIFDTGLVEKIEVSDASTGNTYTFNSKKVIRSHVNRDQVLTEVGGASISTGTAGCEDIFTTKIKSQKAVEDAISSGKLSQSCMITETSEEISFDFDDII